MPSIEKTMFREYDLRGLVTEPNQMSDENMNLMGKAIGTMMKAKSRDEMVIGYDGREYSERLHDQFVDGVLSTGVNVTSLGMVLSPILYFSQFHLNIKAGAMITASHNPNGWSGLKVGYDLADTFLPDDMQEFYKVASSGTFDTGAGKLKKYDKIIEDYAQDVLSRVNIKKKLKVVIDCGNGTAAEITPMVFERMGAEVVPQFCVLDPDFPNHEPNPSLKEAQDALSKGVLDNNADLGVAIDGDGDRLGLADEKGEIIFADKALILLARQALEKSPGGSVVFDVKATRALPEDIEAHGGKPVMWKTGHSYIKQKAKETKAVLAGERSGHIFFQKGYYGFDDGTFAGMKMTEYLSQQDKPLSEVMKTVPQYVSSPEYYPDAPDEKKYEIAEQLTKEFKEEYGEDKVIDINGARVDFGDGWGLVRASSNQPKLLVIFEAKTKERMDEIAAIFRKKLDKYNEVGKEWEY